jgi:hypothetical protein
MNDCTYLLYTHSDYDDVLEITLKRLQKYFPSTTIVIATNNAQLIEQKYKTLYNITDVYQYTDSLPYSSKVASVLEQIKTTYILFNHYINILFDTVDVATLNGILDTMQKEEIDTVRLCSAGIQHRNMSDESLLKRNTGSYFLSVISALWNTASFLRLCQTFPDRTYRNFELGETQPYAAQLENYYISSSKDKPPYWSVCYPFFHSITYGVWLLNEHRELVEGLIKEYGIDVSIRGFR